jgi:hypothetical protein
LDQASALSSVGHEAGRHAGDELRAGVGVGELLVELADVAQPPIDGNQPVGINFAADLDEPDVPVLKSSRECS